MTIPFDDLQADLEELVSAEDFLEYFAVPFERAVVQVNRLHILQRFHNYLAQAEQTDDRVADYRQCLERAYQDFVGSSAQEQKVLRVFATPEPGFVSLDEFH